MSCNGCRVLRKGCSEGCMLRPCLAGIEGADAQGHATLFLAKFFGRAGLMGFIAAVSEAQRPALFQSLLYEACGRTINPVYGSAGLLWSGQWHTCETAVETVLKGGSLQNFSPGLHPTAPQSAFPCQTSASMSTPTNSVVSNGTAPFTFHFPTMEATTMAYWPMAMAPMGSMDNARMAAMGGAASAAAAYQASMYRVAASSQASYSSGPYSATTTSAPCVHPVPSYSAARSTNVNAGPVPAHSHITTNKASSISSQPWHGQVQSQAPQTCMSPVPGANVLINGTSQKSSSPSSGNGVRSPSPPLVAPVARRLRPNTGPAPFMPGLTPGSVSPPPHITNENLSRGMDVCTVPAEPMNLVKESQADFGLNLAAWGARSHAPEPASHSLLPLMS